MSSTEKVSTLQTLCQKLLEQAELYQKAHDRDEIFEVKRRIIGEIKSLQKQIAQLRESLDSKTV